MYKKGKENEKKEKRKEEKGKGKERRLSTNGEKKDPHLLLLFRVRLRLKKLVEELT